MKKRLEKFCKDICSAQSEVFHFVEDGVTIQVKVLSGLVYELKFFENGELQLQCTHNSYKSLRYEILKYFGFEA